MVTIPDWKVNAAARIADLLAEQKARAAADTPEARQRRADWRSRLYFDQRTAQRLAPDGARVCECGRRLKAEKVVFGRDQRGRPGFRNLRTCGSKWHCPVCAVRAGARSRDDVLAVCRGAVALGMPVYMAAFTVKHDRWQTAADLVAAVTGAWRKLRQGRRWQAMKAGCGFLGDVRALEVTHGGAAGWHPHLHVLAFFDPASTAQQRRVFGYLLWRRWRALAAKGGFGPLNPALWQWEPARRVETAADYVTKWTSAAEIAQGVVKHAKGGNRTPWQLLHDAGNGDEAAGQVWREYAAAFDGKKQLTWSVGIRKIVGAAPDPEDDELPDELPADAREIFYVFDQAQWRRVLELGLKPAMIRAAELGGAASVRELMNSYGMDRYAALAPPDDPSDRLPDTF